MKIMLALFISLASAGYSVSQITYRETATLGPEDVIRRMIATGGYEGHDNKILAGMGDAAAVLVTKVVADKHLSAGEIDTVLTVLNISFAGTVNDAPNQEPRTALFVLQLCDSSTQDPELKTRIAQTRAYIQQQYAKSLKTSEK